MKTKLLGVMLLAGSSLFAETHFSIGIGVGGHVTVRTREHNGRIRETRYLLDRRGSTLVWED